MRRMVARLQLFASGAGIVVALVGLTALAGWVYDRDDLKSLFVRPPVTMKSNTSVALLAAGLSLWLLRPEQRSLARTLAGRTLAAFVLALALATLSQHLLRVDLGIDQMLFREPPGALATASPNRMGPPGSLCLALLGACLLGLDARGRYTAGLRQAAAILAVLVAMLGIIGYATSVSPLYALARLTGIALVTAIVLLVLATGVLAARPDYGLMGLLCQPDEAGALARRVIGPALLLPLGAAVALTRGVSAGWFDERFATALMALTVTISLGAVLWKTTAGLSRALRARDAAEAVRARREDALRVVNRRQTEFLAVLSHELRNPLAPMRYALDMMGGGGEPGPKEVVERQMAHLVRLVDDLLDVSRIATGKIQLRRRPMELGQLMAQVVEALRPEIERRECRLIVEEPAAPLWLDGDPDRLAQVLTNLLNNAARYTPPRGVITLAAEEAGDRAVIRVGDTGVGLQADDLERVFEMFSQIGGPEAGGLGIGLALVKTVAELHGGTVEARSDGPGKGSEFRVFLPRAAAPMGVKAPALATAAAAHRKVVVADDNEDAAEMMRALLELDGHTVQVAGDGQAALDLIAAFSPEVAVLDIGMPGMDGYEVARRVRAQGRQVYLIAVTGWGQESDRRRAEAAGFDAHLTKPANPDDIRRLVSAR